MKLNFLKTYLSTNQSLEFHKDGRCSLTKYQQPTTTFYIEIMPRDITAM